MTEKKHKEMVIWAPEKARLGQGDWGQVPRPASWGPRAGKPSPESLHASGLLSHVLSSSPGSEGWGGTEVFLGHLSGQKRAWARLHTGTDGQTAAGGSEGRRLAAPISKELCKRDSCRRCYLPSRCSHTGDIDGVLFANKKEEKEEGQQKKVAGPFFPLLGIYHFQHFSFAF